MEWEIKGLDGRPSNLYLGFNVVLPMQVAGCREADKQLGIRLVLPGWFGRFRSP
jgi:hypothetical protein